MILVATPRFASPMMGTWKLNEAKSKLAPGADKNHTVVYAAAGDQVKVTVDRTKSSLRFSVVTFEVTLKEIKRAEGVASNESIMANCVNDRVAATAEQPA